MDENGLHECLGMTNISFGDRWLNLKTIFLSHQTHAPIVESLNQDSTHRVAGRCCTWRRRRSSALRYATAAGCGRRTTSAPESGAMITVTARVHGHSTRSRSQHAFTARTRSVYDACRTVPVLWTAAAISGSGSARLRTVFPLVCNLRGGPPRTFFLPSHTFWNCKKNFYKNTKNTNERLACSDSVSRKNSEKLQLLRWSGHQA